MSSATPGSLQQLALLLLRVAKERLEAVVVATPLFLHADVAVEPLAEASESRAVEAAGLSVSGGRTLAERVNAYALEVSGFCASIRTGVPLRCGPAIAMGAARACLSAHEAIQDKKRVVLPASA